MRKLAKGGGVLLALLGIFYIMSRGPLTTTSTSTYTGNGRARNGGNGGADEQGTTNGEDFDISIYTKKRTRKAYVPPRKVLTGLDITDRIRRTHPGTPVNINEFLKEVPS